MFRKLVDIAHRRSLSITSVLLLASLVLLVISLSVAVPRHFEDRRQDALRAAVADMQVVVGRIDQSLSCYHDVLDLFSDELDALYKDDEADEVFQKLFNVNYLANVRNNRNVVSFYGYVNGRFIASDIHGEEKLWVPPSDYDPIKRPWYRTAVDAGGKIGCSDPYIDIDTGEKVFSLAKLLSDGKSVVAIDVRADGIVKDLQSRHAIRYGHVVVFSSSGEILMTDCRDPVDGKAFEGFCRRVIWPECADMSGEKSFTAFGKSGKPVRAFASHSRFGLVVATVFKEEEFRNAYKRPIRHVWILTNVFSVCFIVTALVGYIRLKGLNRDLKARNLELVRVQKAKSTFFSMVSHDLRTPLNAIVGFADILRLGTESQEEQDEAVETIYDSGQAMLGMVSDLLDVARLDHGELSINPAECDIGEVIDAVKRMASARQQGDDSSVLVTSVDSVPPVMFDANRLRQILSNLVDNSFKFSPAGSEVALRVRWNQDSAASDTGRLTIEVEDQGMGIPEAAHTRIFEPFEQACDNNHRGAGVGLGLTICKSLTERMGGKITLRSTVGVGTVFTLDFPNVRKVAGVGSAPPSETGTEKAAKDALLIVDDLGANIKVLGVCLKRLGETNIVVAADGAEAIRILDESPDGTFKAVLTDLWMPHLDGYGLLREIRSRPRFKNLPVCAITADCEAASSYPIDEFSGFIQKPLNIDKLKQLLEGAGVRT